MNNASTPGNQGGQSTASSKNKLYLLFKHMAIPATTIFVAAGIILGFITAVHWSVLVTGTGEYTGYIFKQMSASMMLIVFIGLLAYSVLPFFAGYLAVTISGYEKTGTQKHKTKLIQTVIIIIIIYIICFSLLYFLNIRNKWIIVLTYLLGMTLWSISYYYFFTDEKKRNLKNLFTKSLVFTFYTIIGSLSGVIIIINDIMASSISNTKVDVLSILLISGTPLLLTIFGVIYASDDSKEAILIGLFTALSITLIIMNIPQNTVIGLDHGTIRTPAVLEKAINNIIDNKKHACITMHIIKNDGYALFSCGQQTNIIRGEIFYRTTPKNLITEFDKIKKMSASASCDKIGKNHLRCIYGFNLT